MRNHIEVASKNVSIINTIYKNKLRMKNKYVLCLLWILILYSCNNKNQGDILSGFYKIENISNTSIKLENDSILHQVFGLICSNNNLIAYDVDGTYFFSFTDLKSNTMLSKVAKQGQGPNEVVGYPQSISLIDKHTFSFFESNKCILYSVNFKDPSYPRLKKKVVLNRDDGIIMSMIPLPPYLYIALGHFEQGRYLLLDKEGKKISYNFEYPKLPNDEMFTNAHKAMAFQGEFMGRPDGERFFFACTNSEVFEIIEVSQITVNGEDNTLYGIDPNSDSNLVEFLL